MSAKRLRISLPWLVLAVAASIVLLWFGFIGVAAVIGGGFMAISTSFDLIAVLQSKRDLERAQQENLASKQALLEKIKEVEHQIPKVFVQSLEDQLAAARALLAKTMDRKWKRPSLPPLSTLDRIAYFVYSKKVYERVFKAARADVVYEWGLAKKNDEIWKARYIKWVRGPYTFFSHVIAHAPGSFVKWLIAQFKAEKAPDDETKSRFE
jgi:hypothetical protein